MLLFNQKKFDMIEAEEDEGTPKSERWQGMCAIAAPSNVATAWPKSMHIERCQWLYFL